MQSCGCGLFFTWLIVFFIMFQKKKNLFSSCLVSFFFFNYHLGVDYVFGCNFEFVLKLVMCFICVEVTKTGIPEASE